MHLTLRFLGDTLEDRVPDLRRAMEMAIEEWQASLGPASSSTSQRNLELQLKGLGAFPPRGPPRVMWVGLAGRDLPLLMDLASILDDWLHESGLGRADRPFKPHLTLARVRDKRAVGFVRQTLRDHERSLFGDLELDRMVLFSSQLTPQAPIYTELHEAGL